MKIKPWIRIVFYVATLIFHMAVLFTNIGNFFHGGTVVGLVSLQAIAVLIIFLSFDLLFKVGLAERVLVILSTIMPIVSVSFSLISAFERLVT